LSWVVGLHELNELRVVLADKGLLVIAGNVMPHHPVAIKVKHGQTCLIIFVLKESEKSLLWRLGI
jgi:hypothetical protein